ncbi:hypothetical protein GCE86_19675 [Micromonospora terminaliae]|uniref:Uncharacterized protein n=1 Tax=Micromonospora terminaliae TaxID=1914461 RepID=A0AAJ2ZFJ7_9ACTN|nr:hypothetical protein [Micromonospora terminaliae]NES28948.1 hypothetical protein [Micromonospora terminaliae]QGL49033.1 hypothetical protein GCE86_19675 [Micromonospora terminaliae]
MAWPDDEDLTVKVEAAFGADVTADPDTWSWTDLSSRLRAEPIRIRAGKSSGASVATPSTCAVTLDNPDSALMPGHPQSPYWPNVQLGTPLRVRVQWNGVWHDRFSGFADQWEPRFVPTTTPGEADAYVIVTASGILRRLGQGSPRAMSAMRRSLAASGPVAYWPVEDGDAASRVGSAVAGAAPLTITGTAKFADIETWTEGQGYEVRYGSAALVDLSGGAVLSALLPAAATAATAGAGGWTAALAADVPAAASNNMTLLEVHTPTGSITAWRLVITTTSHTQIHAWTGASWTVVVDSSSVFISMSPHNFAVWQSSPGVITAAYGWSSVGGWKATGTIAGTVAGVTQVVVNPAGTTATEPVPAGHIAVWAGHGLNVVDKADGSMIRALYAYEWSGLAGSGQRTGEGATQRLARLAAEDGIALDMPPVDPASEVMMGRQGPGTQLDLYQECAEADMGVLYESGFGLGYLPRQDRYNPPVALAVDLAAYCVTRGSNDVLSPVLDDQGMVNELTVERRDGSTVVVADEDSQRQSGVYSTSVELNLVDDSALPDQAAFRLYLARRRAS